jgi:hypothetical protein
MIMADDFTQRFQYGLNNLPDEPPDDPNILFSPNGFTSIGTQRAAQAQVVPAQFRNSVRRMWSPGSYPGQGGGLAPGGGPVTEIPMPEWWKTWGPVLQEILPDLHPMAALGRERRRRGASAGSRSQARDDDGDWCYQRYLQELKECADNRDNYAHPDFEAACKKRATERWDKCNRNGGRPHPEEPLKWGKADEDIYFETSR